VKHKQRKRNLSVPSAPPDVFWGNRPRSEARRREKNKSIVKECGGIGRPPYKWGRSREEKKPHFAVLLGKGRRRPASLVKRGERIRTYSREKNGKGRTG